MTITPFTLPSPETQSNAIKNHIRRQNPHLSLEQRREIIWNWTHKRRRRQRQQQQQQNKKDSDEDISSLNEAAISENNEVFYTIWQWAHDQGLISEEKKATAGNTSSDSNQDASTPQESGNGTSNNNGEKSS